MTNSLMERIKKKSTIKEAEVLSKSSFFDEENMIPTEIPILNIALSGSLNGGLTSGHLALAGPSKHYKTLFSLVMGKAFLEKYEDGVIIFYDTEFGSPKSYFKNNGIDPNRVLHVPIADIEYLKTDIIQQMNGLEKKDNVMIIIDSIGNISSRKELEDAENAKVVADMTRAKSLKSLFRMITPLVKMKDIPLITINHTYDTMEMYSKQVVSGGKGIIYSANNIWIIGRQQEKDLKTKEITGYTFVVNIEKSRYVKEKSKFLVEVSWENGIDKYSGLFDIALQLGYIVTSAKGYYNIIDPLTGEFLIDGQLRKGKIKEDFKEILEMLLEKTNFATAIEKTYMIEKEDENE